MSFRVRIENMRMAVTLKVEKQTSHQMQLVTWVGELCFVSSSLTRLHCPRFSMALSFQFQRPIEFVESLCNSGSPGCEALQE